MLACLFLLIPLQAQPEVSLPAGAPIVLDGKLETAEWQGSFSVTRPLGEKHKLRFHLLRNGQWLAIGLGGDREYAGEILRMYVSDEKGSWVATVFFGIGQPAVPPGLWRRGHPRILTDPEVRPECPRGVRARLDVGAPDHWSAEYLVRLATFGIGRRDARTFRTHITVSTPGKMGNTYLSIPENVKELTDTGSYALLKPEGGWGDDEEWKPIGKEISREFDDHELLYRLFLEHDKFAQRISADQLVIASAVRPRSDTKINSLRSDLEAGRARNPTLPAWTYFLGRLLHEGNHFAEARKIIEAVPPALARLGPFVNLAAEHYTDTLEFQKALDLCRGRTDVLGIRETVATALNVRRALAEEKKAIEEDDKKSEKNPRVKIVTAKGDIVCELFEDDAPLAVRNFIDLVMRDRFYDGVTFHLVAGGALAQTGDPSTRKGATSKRDNPGWRLKPDKPKRKLLRGYLGVVPVEGDVFHGSQFFIAVAPMLRERKLVAFGRVVEGLDVLDRIEQDDRIERVEIIRKRNHVYDPLDSRMR